LVVHTNSNFRLKEKESTKVPKQYKITPIVRAQNAMVKFFIKLGLKMGPMILLTVNGRKSGVPRSTPVALLEENGKRWLVGTFGDTNWVRNLRAAGEAVIKQGGRTETIRAIELTPKEAAPVLKSGLQTRAGAFFAGPYFEAKANSPLEEFEREAPQHPVFEIRRAG
jgi:deazaflavin-dependent oxidoreductase (nitroreductase family)